MRARLVRGETVELAPDGWTAEQYEQAVADAAATRERQTFPERMAHAQQEQSVWRRLSPRRSHWPEVAEYDARVNALDRRQHELAAEALQLEQELKDAENRDQEMLSAWVEGGEQGPRPTLAAPPLRTRLEARRLDRDAVDPARERVLAEKAEFVAKTRQRLVAEADAATERARCRYLELITELEQAREEAFECRLASLWAAVYPGEAMLAMPPSTLLGGSTRALSRLIPGLVGSLDLGHVLDVLRADGDYVRSASTRELDAATGSEHREPDAAVWAGTPEAVEQDRAERKRALQRYREIWGRDPA